MATCRRPRVDAADGRLRYSRAELEAITDGLTGSTTTATARTPRRGAGTSPRRGPEPVRPLRRSRQVQAAQRLARPQDRRQRAVPGGSSDRESTRRIDLASRYGATSSWSLCRAPTCRPRSTRPSASARRSRRRHERRPRHSQHRRGHLPHRRREQGGAARQSRLGDVRGQRAGATGWSPSAARPFTRGATTRPPTPSSRPSPTLPRPRRRRPGAGFRSPQSSHVAAPATSATGRSSGVWAGTPMAQPSSVLGDRQAENAAKGGIVGHLSGGGDQMQAESSAVAMSHMFSSSCASDCCWTAAIDARSATTT